MTASTPPNTAEQPDPDLAHIVGRTARVAGSGMHETACSCGVTVHDLDAGESAAALNPHRVIGAERAARLAGDVPRFTDGGATTP